MGKNKGSDNNRGKAAADMQGNRGNTQMKNQNKTENKKGDSSRSDVSSDRQGY